MANNHEAGFLPTGEDLQTLKTMLDEATKCMRRMEDESEAKKNIVKEIKTVFGIPPKQINLLLKTLYKQNFPEVQAEAQAFEDLYMTVVQNKKSK